MRGSLIVVTGTGTEIGKTHVACALLLGAKAHRVFGYKPVESGVVDGVVTDAQRLDEASTFHVKQSPGLRLRAGLSPHLAAEMENASLDWESVVRFVEALRDDGVHVLVELAGGLFTPLTSNTRNVDVVASLAPTTTLLLAPDRLGVLHDVGSTLAGATRVGVRVDVVGVIACARRDASAGQNERELARFIDVPVVGTWERATPQVLAESDITKHVLYMHWRLSERA